MKILKFLLYVALSIGALVVALGLFAKKDYHVERSMVINAPQFMIHDYVRQFKNFNAWSPWSPLDPEMKTEIMGTDGEVGAKYSWKGNDNVGQGQQTITAITPNQIDMKVEFTEPFASTSPSSLKFEPAGEGTKVSWGFDMHVGFPWNAFAMFTDMDAAVGKDYETGLDNLRKLMEGDATRKYKGYQVKYVADFPSRTYYGLRSNVDSSAVPKFLATALPKTLIALSEAKLEPNSAPTGLYYTWEKGKTDLLAGMSAPVGQNFPGLASVTIGGKAALTIDFYGSYQNTILAHEAMANYMDEHKLAYQPPAIEEYITDPTTEKDTAKWLTRIIYLTDKR
jgi:effector-binding domain-containing protein